MSERSFKKKHFLYINLDGFASYYFEGVESRYPAFYDLISQSAYFTSCYSSIPSITVPMQVAIVTAASSSTTQNCYQYYDRENKEIVYTKRLNQAQTIGELYKENNMSMLSIQQFAVENHGCTAQDPNYLYLQPGGDYKTRFDMLIKYYKSKTIASFTFENYHDAVLLYCDDLDTVGHNGKLPIALSEEQRVKNVRKRLSAIDAKLAQLITTLKEVGLYEDITLLITADHGMVHYQGPSKLTTLIEDIEKITNLKVTSDVKEEADILLIGNTIQCQLYYLKEKGTNQEFLKTELEKKEYVEKVLTSKGLSEEKVARSYADMLISPKEGYAFFNNDKLPKNYIGASHDSLNIKAQKVFALIKHKDIVPAAYAEPIKITNLIPTILKLDNFPSLKTADYGSVIW